MNSQLIEDTIIIEVDRHVYLYSLASKKAAKVEVSSYNPERFKQLGFFNEAKPQRNIHLIGPLFLLLTRDCPLACKYCYASAGHKKEFMPLEIAENAIEAYLSLFPTLPNVRFGGGGEPALAEKLIRCIIEKFGNRNIAWSMISSGFFSKNFLNWLIERRVNITFSLDGPPEIQDTHRPLKSGLGSSTIVEDNCRIYRRKRNKLHIRCTLTKFSIENLEKILCYFQQIGITMLSVEPMYPMGRGRDTKNSIFIPTPEETVEAIVQILEWGRKTGVVIRTIALFHPSFISDLTYCGPINGNAYVVNHNGYLLACGEALDPEHPFWDIWVIGKLNGSHFEIDEEKQKWLIEHTTVKAMETCRHCFAKYVCRGGCPMRRLFQTGKIDEPDPYHCFVARNLLINLVIRMVEGKYPNLILDPRR